MAEALPSTSDTGQRSVEFSIHGVVDIRFIDPSAADVSNIIEPLRLAAAPANGQTDITVRFLPQLDTGALNFIGRHSMAYDEHGFYVLHKTSDEVEARIPLERIGGHCEITCRNGLAAVPLLNDIIALTFVHKGYLHLHASAFSFGDRGVLVVGWSNGGKTDMLLAFANHGADYVGDELVVMAASGRRLYGIPIPLAIWDWQFAQIPKFLPAISLRRRMIFKLIHALDALYRKQAQHVRFPGFDILSKALPTLRRQLKIWMPPQALCAGGIHQREVRADKLFLIMSQSAANVTIERCDNAELAQRMLASNEYERWHLMQYYKAFRFAFPTRHNEFLERLDTQQRESLPAALDGVEAYVVKHPHGLDFETLFNALRDHCK